MLRAAAITVSLLVLACGSDPAPHALTTCNGWVDNQGTPIMGRCEAACESPPASAGDVCDTVAMLGCRAFEFSGTRGCCVQDMDAMVIKFHECAN